MCVRPSSRNTTNLPTPVPIAKASAAGLGVRGAGGHRLADVVSRDGHAWLSRGGTAMSVLLRGERTRSFSPGAFTMSNGHGSDAAVQPAIRPGVKVVGLQPSRWSGVGPPTDVPPRDTATEARSGSARDPCRFKQAGRR